MRRAHDSVVTVGIPRQSAADNARSATADAHFSETQYALDGGASRQNYLADRRTLQAALDQLYALPTNAIDKPLVAAIRSAVARFDDGDVVLWRLIQTHNSKAARQLVDGSQNDAADALIAALVADQKSAAADVAAQTAEFNTRASSSRLLMIVVGFGRVLGCRGDWLGDHSAAVAWS